MCSLALAAGFELSVAESSESQKSAQLQFRIWAKSPTPGIAEALIAGQVECRVRTRNLPPKIEQELIARHNGSERLDRPAFVHSAAEVAAR